MTSGTVCPVCGSSSVRLVQPSEPPLQTLRCNSCSTAWSVRAPAADLTPPLDPDWASLPPRPRILVLDDDPAITPLIASWLVDMAVVHTATSSAQALALANVVHFDLAIVDVILPRQDGFTVADTLRRDHLRQMPVIFITGSDRFDIGMRAVDAGAAAVLFKPLDEEVLRDAVRTLLLGRRGR
jgi:CheY-like chemotaxis protein